MSTINKRDESTDMQTNSKPAVERSTDGKTPDAGMRPGASAKTVDNERRILRAAEEEFLCKGFDGARTTAIAERAGVTHAMLHYYFRTKEKLFDKILEDKVSELRRVLFGFLDNEELPFCERIEQGMRNHFAFLTKNPHLPLFIINELHRENNSVQKQRQANRAVIEEFQATLQDSAVPLTRECSLSTSSRSTCRPSLPPPSSLRCSVPSATTARPSSKPASKRISRQF